jgi:hypothetical protein
MASPNVVFLTGRAKSLGESYTALQMARDLRACGWSTTFLAFEFAASFLRDQGVPVVELSDDRAHNRRALQSASPAETRMMITVDYYLLRSADAAPFWDSRWLDEFGRPVATLDHLGFHPGASMLEIGFQRVATSHWSTPKEVPIEELPPSIQTVLRPCPLHSPSAGPDPRVRPFRLPPCAPPGPEAVAGARSRLGLSSDEKLVVLSMGSWVLQAANDLRIPYRETVVRLLAGELVDLRIPVRLAFVCAEEPQRIERVGHLTVHYLGKLSFSETEALLSAADLVLSDNVTSSTISRAVLRQVPTAVFVNSAEASTTDGALSIEAPFLVSQAAREAIARMDAEAPGSVFPAWVYPLGWRRALEPLFRDNPYRSTTEWLELFDETTARESVARLLCDSACRTAMRARQRSYADSIAGLPLPRDVIPEILGN